MTSREGRWSLAIKQARLRPEADDPKSFILNEDYSMVLKLEVDPCNKMLRFG